MDNKIAKSYILETTVLNTGRSLEKHLRYMRRGGSFCTSFLVFVLLHFALEVYDGSDIIRSGAVLLTILSTIIPAIVAFKRQWHIVKTWEIPERINEEPDETEKTKPRSNVVIYGTIGALVGISIIRALELSPQAQYILIALVYPIIVELVYVACVNHYKLYLMKKYCPELRDVK